MISIPGWSLLRVMGGKLRIPLAGIPDFNTEELEALLHDLPTTDDANEAAVMTMVEAVQVRGML